jgi:2-oxoglutarate ferredoxin oxidoreductase subunit alpha
LGRRVSKIFVPEMNRGQISGEVMKYADCDVTTYTQTDGEVIHPRTIVEALRSLP